MNVMELNGSESRTGRLTPLQLTHTHRRSVQRQLPSAPHKIFLHLTILHFCVCVASKDTLANQAPGEGQGQVLGSLSGHTERLNMKQTHTGQLAGVYIFEFSVHSVYSVIARGGRGGVRQRYCDI